MALVTPLSRRSLIKARWWTWWSAAALVALALLSLGGWQGHIVAQIARMKFGWWLIAALAFLATLVWQARGGLQSLLSFYDLRHFSVRPPYWLSCVAGVVMSLFAASNVDTISVIYKLSLDDQIEMQTWGYALLYAFMAFSVLGLTGLWESCGVEQVSGERGSVANGEDGATPTLAKTSLDELVKWVRDDQPIGSMERDLFDHQQIARRIADRLTSTSFDMQSDDMSQAIVGRFGSGKTSILRLVCRELQRRRRSDIKVIEVQMWPYETARAAVVGIIDRLVGALGEQVNVLALRGVSGAYAEAISAAPGGSVLLAALRSRPEQPAEALAAIDNVARVIGVHYVVWLEDLERFASGDAGDEKLAIVRALLHGLHCLPSFTVITATTDLSHRLDLDKIARYVERVPELPPLKVQELCQKFLSLWREQARERGCIVVDAPVYETGSMEAYRYSKALLGHHAFDLPSAIGLLLPTPRALKQSLRRCEEAWQRLMGEVNLDEMLAMCIVRESLPREYALIERHLERLREDPKDRRQNAPDPFIEFRSELRKDLASESPQIVGAVTQLVKEIFSGYGRTRLQGLSINKTHVDYWKRFSELSQLPKTQSDQWTLRALSAGTSKAALDVIETDYGGAAAVHLVARVQWEKFVALLVPLLRRRVTESPEQRDSEGEGVPRGFISLHNAIQRHERMHESVDDLVAKIGEAIDICTQESGLAILPSLECIFFTDSDPPVAQLLSPSHNAALRQRARESVARSIREPHLLVKAMRATQAETLLRCVWGAGAMRVHAHWDSTRQPFATWRAVAAVVLDALDADADVMAPQVAHMVFVPVDNYGQELRFDVDLCVARFGGVERVANAISRSVASTSFMQAIHSALDRWDRSATKTGAEAHGVDAATRATDAHVDGEQPPNPAKAADPQDGGPNRVVANDDAGTVG